MNIPISTYYEAATFSKWIINRILIDVSFASRPISLKL